MTEFLKKIFFVRFHSLKLSMLYALFISISVAVGTFFLVEWIGESYIQKEYLKEESRVQREAGYLEDLQNYVDQKKLISTDTEELSAWVSGKGYLYVMIYKDDQLVLDSDSAENFEQNVDSGAQDTGIEGGEQLPDGAENGEGVSGDSSGITVTFPTREDLIAYAKEKGTYPIEMCDGVPLLVSMVDYTEYLYYDMINISSLVISAIVLTAIIMIYFAGITGRMTRLGKNVARVALGDMNHEIKVDRRLGRDEITDLATNVENMRLAMLENIEKERVAINSNTELITSMSHDIRTPLTVLLGYIDIMKTRNNDGKMQEYLAASESCALRLKTMSDDMFNYFAVFGGGVESCIMEEYDAPTLIEQVFLEKILLLREQGYTVDIPMLENIQVHLKGIIVTTNIAKLMRITDNIFSNITKYADKSHPVSIKGAMEGDKLIAIFVNKSSQNANKTESNGIGLRTCKKLAELLNIDFYCKEEKGYFHTTLVLRVRRETNA